MNSAATASYGERRNLGVRRANYTRGMKSPTPDPMLVVFGGAYW